MLPPENLSTRSPSIRSFPRWWVVRLQMTAAHKRLMPPSPPPRSAIFLLIGLVPLTLFSCTKKAMDKHPSAQARATTTASTIVSVLAVISVALRFWTRRIIKAGYKADDWWILVGLVFMLSTGGVLLYGTRPSFEHSLWSLIICARRQSRS